MIEGGVIKPFRAFFPKAQIAEKLVYTFDSLQSLNGTSTEKKHAQVSSMDSTFYKLLNSELIEQDPENSYYIYRLKKNHHIQTGIISLVNVKAYLENRIIKHESISSKNTSDISQFFHEDIQIDPIILAYRENQFVTNIIDFEVSRQPNLGLRTQDAVEHSVWRIEDCSLIERLTHLLSQINHFYIADGHHRLELLANASSNKNTYFLAALFSQNQLSVSAYNKIIYDMDNFNMILERLKSRFSLSSLKKGALPTRKHEVTLCILGQWYKLSLSAYGKSKMDAEVFNDFYQRNITQFHGL